MNSLAISEPELKILVVEDEVDLSTMLEYVLGKEGFRVVTALTGQEALSAWEHERPDLILLDLMLPDMDGLDILTAIRQRSGEETPRVIVLSARKEESDRVRGLELGADDYLVKPFSPRELVLRIKALLQREQRGGEVVSNERRVAAGPIEIDAESHEAFVEGQAVHLTLTEFKLLAALVRNAGRVRTREALLQEVWGYDSEAMSRTVDTHVRRLRTKLGSAASWLGTVRGVGYRIRNPEA